MFAIRVESLVLTFNYVTNFIFHGRLDLLVFGIVILDTGLDILDTNLEVSDIVFEILDVDLEILDLSLEFSEVGLEILDMDLDLSDRNSVMIDVDFWSLVCQAVSFLSFNLFLHCMNLKAVLSERFKYGFRVFRF